MDTPQVCNRRRVLAWLLPTVNNLLAGASIQAPSLLMVLALITLAANWQRLR
jgi:hypothetical protein